MVCQGHIYYIDSEWNGFVSYNPIELPLKYRKKALADRKNRKIIHWAEEQGHGKSRIMRVRSSGGTWHGALPTMSISSIPTSAPSYAEK